MVKRQTRKKVMLPNGSTFYARYKRATHGRGFKSAFGKLMRFAKNVSAKNVRNNKAFKNVVGAVLKELPGTIGNFSKRVKNKKLKSILDTNITKKGIDLGTGYAMDKLNN